MLAVIQNHQRRIIDQVVHHLGRRVAVSQGKADRLSDRPRNVTAAGHRGQIGEPHPAGPTCQFRLAGGDRHPGLARPTHRRHHHQPVRAQQPADLPHLVVAADQSGRP